MKHNTSTLGYKLLSRTLSERRVHSEQLNKYLAGLFDADGVISFNFKKHTTGKRSCYLQSSLTQAFGTDPDGLLLRSLQEFYKIGKIYYIIPENENWSAQTKWYLNSKDSRKLFNIIGKHLRIKGTHFDNLIWAYESLRGYTELTDENTLELKEFSEFSRNNSRWLKHPKHLAPAWMAGFTDGDGHWCCRLGRVRAAREGTNNTLKLMIGVAHNDRHILEFIKKQYKGSLIQRKDGTWIWSRALGKNSATFAVRFLKDLSKYVCLEHKYNKIQTMLKFHRPPAETERIEF